MEKLNVMNSQMGFRPAFEKQKILIVNVPFHTGGHGAVKKQEEQLHSDDSHSNAKPEEEMSQIFLKYTSVTQSILCMIFLMYVATIQPLNCTGQESKKYYLQFVSDTLSPNLV